MQQIENPLQFLVNVAALRDFLAKTHAEHASTRIETAIEHLDEVIFKLVKSVEIKDGREAGGASTVHVGTEGVQGGDGAGTPRT